MEDFLKDCTISGCDYQTLAELKERVLSSPGLRLKWRVLKTLGALPSQAREMTDGDWLFCAVNLLLDAEGLLPESGVNPAFDSEKFVKMRGSGL